MIKRIIEISSSAYLYIKNSQLIIDKETQTHRVPFEDIGFLILDNPRITASQAVFRLCAVHNVALIVTDDKHLPAAMLLSMEAHSTQGKIVRMQVAVAKETQQQIWQQIVAAKIAAQSYVVEKVTGYTNAQLQHLAINVTLADKGGNESQAAKIYFALLFGKTFRRSHQGSHGVNALLNYGYTLVRSACARALMGAGLHPAFGIQHHNQYNMFCLADDIMEPLRPLVDIKVFDYLRENTIPSQINSEQKYALLEILSTPLLLKKRKIALMVALGEYCASLRKVYEKGKGQLTIPTICAQN